MQITRDTLFPFSPRTWGWSEVRRDPQPGWRVFPTHVGMVRRRGRVGLCRVRFPHARGDGPHGGCVTASGKEFSPRTWGWSDDMTPTPEQQAVFPTHVGMVRLWHEPSGYFWGFPHARGDGPAGCIPRGV